MSGEAVATEARVVVEADRDIVSARQQGRVMAAQQQHVVGGQPPTFKHLDGRRKIRH